MQFSFTATIKKAGINPCVSVPAHISCKMKPVKGYIPVKGKIGSYSFIQTLIPVKNEGYRLYVNGPMLKGARVEVGDAVKFIIEQNTEPSVIPMLPLFKKELEVHKLLPAFYTLTPFRQKEILKYLNNLKTEEALTRNIAKVIGQLK